MHRRPGGELPDGDASPRDSSEPPILPPVHHALQAFPQALPLRRAARRPHLRRLRVVRGGVPCGRASPERRQRGRGWDGGGGGGGGGQQGPRPEGPPAVHSARRIQADAGLPHGWQHYR